MLYQQRFQNEDLMLRVSTNIDRSRFDITDYEPFIDMLCGNREYQKEAIRVVLRYLLGGRYANLRQLADENFYAHEKLQQRYSTFPQLEKYLQLSDQLSCSIDLATATGKSYVMYGIARIMLAHGAVDRVLVLCPSRTIEKGLMEKFDQLSRDEGLKDTLPSSSHIFSPHIINGSESIVEGSICIENFHATLLHVKSSIRASLAGKGTKTLVLNDEAHHIYNPTNKDLGRWIEFLLDDSFGFRYIVGLSGTCYMGNEYFADVVYRYSLRQAIEEGYAKAIDYVAEDSSTSQDERFQKIYDNHNQNKKTYRYVKPLTILITRDISECKELTSKLTKFLAQQENLSSEDAAKKVLIVTSSREHAANIRMLSEVDRPDIPVEWITSVSMLTEGWDVQNVFQIVPSEERAFNSKLLIAQVLGRGLRIPRVYKGERPVVIVFNHDAWSSNIKHLVDEVMEIEKRIYSYPVSKSKDYNFMLHHIEYDKIPEVEQLFEKEGDYEFTKGYVTLTAQVPQLERETTYIRANTGKVWRKKTRIKYQMFTVEDVAEQIYNRIKSIDLETGVTQYAKRYNLEWLKSLIRASIKPEWKTPNLISEENRQLLYRSFHVLHRQASRVVRYRLSPNPVKTFSTAERKRDGVGLGALKRDEVTIFWDDDSLSASDEETRANLGAVLDDEDLRISAWHHVPNTFDFKTPLNVVIADHKPERDFIRELVKEENADAIDAWIKSTDQDFYKIDYVWRKGEHPKPGTFNPDFFIKQDKHILVIEIKGNEEIIEPSDENKGKFRAASQHFETLNSMQSEYEYHFHFLTKSDYDKFFKFLREKNYSFVSKLDVALEDNN